MTRMFLVPRIRAHKALDWDNAPDRNNTSDWDEFTDADLNYYLRVASDTTDSFFTVSPSVLIISYVTILTTWTDSTLPS